VAIAFLTLFLSGGGTAMSSSELQPVGAPELETAGVPANYPIVVASRNQAHPVIYRDVVAWLNESGKSGFFGNAYTVYWVNLTSGLRGGSLNPNANEESLQFRDGRLSYAGRYFLGPSNLVNGITVLDFRSGQPRSGRGFSPRHGDLATLGFHQGVVTDKHFVVVSDWWSPGMCCALLAYDYGGNSNGGGHAYFSGDYGPVAGSDWVAVVNNPYLGPHGYTTEPEDYITELSAVFPGTKQAQMQLTNNRYLSLQVQTSGGFSACGDLVQEIFPSVTGRRAFWQDNRNTEKFFKDGFDPLMNPCWRARAPDNWDIYSYDLTTRREVLVRNAPWSEARPNSDGATLVWTDNRNGNWDIYALDLETGREWRVTDDPATQTDPAVYGNCIVWADNRHGDWDIYGTCPLRRPNATPTIRSFTATPGLEGGQVWLTATATDLENDPLTYAFDFESDGIYDVSGALPTVAAVFGDDFTGRATVRVSDGHSTAEATTPIRVTNVPPALPAGVEATVTAEVTLRVAGEKWHDLELSITQGGLPTATASVRRMPGSPTEQTGRIPQARLRVLEPISSVVVTYTPSDDPPNGREWGATPAWLTLKFEGGKEVQFSHVFNARDSSTWTWRLPDVRAFLTGVPVHFRTRARDPGSDDLAFHFSWGDSTPDDSVVAYNNGLGPDPPQSPGGIFPFSAEATVVHAFAAPGTYPIRVTVRDDDGGVSAVAYSVAVG